MAQIKVLELLNEQEDPEDVDSQENLSEQLIYLSGLDITDSLGFINLGISSLTIQHLLAWQQAGATESELEFLLNNIDQDDIIRLSTLQQSPTQEAVHILRQRLQYSASAKGWRILQKGRLYFRHMDLVFLLEQDPGEKKILDHAVFALNSRSIPGVDRMIIGDFRIKWGSGILINQSGSRLGLAPSSLVRPVGISMSPHYSSREIGYFRGLAGEFSLRGLHLLTFISLRKLIGQSNSGSFKEDTDGLHPVSIVYETKQEQVAGVGGVFERGPIKIYWGGIISIEENTQREQEYGLQWDVNSTQYISIFSDKLGSENGRSLVNWSYKLKSTHISLQYRHLPSQISNSRAFIIKLRGSSVDSEAGLSARIKFSPHKGIIFRYALDYGQDVHRQTVADLDQVTLQKIQIQISRSATNWQLDWRDKMIGPNIMDDPWLGRGKYTHVSQQYLSLQQTISDHFQYRLNLKTASNDLDRSYLIQQRLVWKYRSWKLNLGLVRYVIPEHNLRLSIYEKNVRESFSFFTAHDDGQRWYLYGSRQFGASAIMEMRVSQVFSFELLESYPQLALTVQMSVVF